MINFIIIFTFIFTSAYAAPELKKRNIKPETHESRSHPSIQFSQSENHSGRTDPEIKNPKEIFLNFDNVPLTRVLNYLAEKKQINLIPHKDLEAQKVTLRSVEPLTLDQAWNILLTLLDQSNFSIVKVDDLYRVVPSAGSRQEPLPLYFGDISKLPDSDLMIRFIYPLTNMRTENLKPLLDQIVAQNSVQYNAALNAIIIADRSSNVKSAMNIVEKLDSSGQKTTYKVVRLKDAKAADVADLFNKSILGSGEQKSLFFTPKKNQYSYFPTSIKILAEPTGNQIIILGTDNNIDKVERFITKYLDKPLDAKESRLHIKELKYADSEQIAPVLQSAIQLPPGKDPKTTYVGDVKYFEDMIIAAEKSLGAEGDKSLSVGGGNRLIIACNRDDWKRMEQIIDDLDKPQPTVALEVLFVDVQAGSEFELGAQFRNKKPNNPINGVNLQTQHLAAIPSTVTTPAPELVTQSQELQANMIGVPAQQFRDGASWVSLGKAAATTLPGGGGIWAVFKGLIETDNFNIISQPFLVANNRVESVLEVKDTRIVQGQVDSSSTTATRANVPIDATSNVKITPTINSTGTISMKIGLSLQEFIGEPREGIDTPDRTRREVVAQMAVNDGEVIVIGGLSRNTVREAMTKTPILGDIPIIGNLFRHRDKLMGKSELYIFIRPTIIKPHFEGGPEDYTRLKLDYSKVALARSTAILDTKDPIQRWFFDSSYSKPSATFISGQKDEFAYVDNFLSGKAQPKAVKIAEDPFFKTKTSRTIQAREREKEKIRSAQQPPYVK